MHRSILSAVALLAASTASAQSRSDWEMHDGLEGLPGYIPNPCASVRTHGAVCQYGAANIPSAGDAGWRDAPNPDIIDFSIRSRLCNAPSTCWNYLDFTYFQTFVTVPENVVVDTFTIAFSGMDDGSRVTIFNSAYPDGVVIPGSYVFLSQSGTADLGAYVVSGEVNRVVVSQVDDCCSGNNLRSAQVVLNGTVIDTNAPPVAECQDLFLTTGPDACSASGSIDNASYDPDGDEITLTEDPGAPYGLGETDVSLEVCDDSGECDTCEAIVTVEDDAAPAVACEAPASIAPADLPASFGATASDNCGATVALSGVTCTAINGAGKLVERDCAFSIDGDVITFTESGGVGTTLSWVATATDEAGNTAETTCTIAVGNPGNGSGCNQGIGNGPEGCDPGNSNQGDPGNSNDENGRGRPKRR